MRYPGGLFSLAHVHVRTAESLLLVRDHRLEPLGSRTYPAAAIWGTEFLTPPNQTMPSQRSLLRQSRRALTRPQQSHAARMLTKNLKRNPCLLRATRIAGYLASDGEIDPAGFLAWCHKRAGKQIYLPVIQSPCIGTARPMLFQRYYPGISRLRRNRLGILEPVFVQSETINPLLLDVVLTPLVGFDRSGHRLGMGGGFYDKTFQRQTWHYHRPALLGLAHAVQEAPISNQTWDIPLDMVITDRETIIVTPT